jgi:hypothetical protein
MAAVERQRRWVSHALTESRTIRRGWFSQIEMPRLAAAPLDATPSP